MMDKKTIINQFRSMLRYNDEQFFVATDYYGCIENEIKSMGFLVFRGSKTMMITKKGD